MAAPQASQSSCTTEDETEARLRDSSGTAKGATQGVNVRMERYSDRQGRCLCVSWGNATDLEAAALRWNLPTGLRRIAAGRPDDDPQVRQVVLVEIQLQVAGWVFRQRQSGGPCRKLADQQIAEPGLFTIV